MAFGPSRVTVGVGETVTWTFQDATAHTVTSDDGFFDTAPTSGGAGRTIRFRSAGTFPYHCSIHSMMVGRVSVPVSATGSVEDGWKLRWLAGDNPKNRAYDVQVRRKGTSTWTSFRKATTTRHRPVRPGQGHLAGARPHAQGPAEVGLVAASGHAVLTPLLDLAP